MRQELLKDLCCRLSYEVKCEVNYKENGKYKTDIMILKGIMIDTGEGFFINESGGSIYSKSFKPYLFPLSSMTEEQREEYESLCIKETSECTDLYGIIFSKDYYYDTIESIDYLYKNHIDIRGLIEKDLALDATGLNIY